MVHGVEVIVDDRDDGLAQVVVVVASRRQVRVGGARAGAGHPMVSSNAPHLARSSFTLVANVGKLLQKKCSARWRWWEGSILESGIGTGTRDGRKGADEEVADDDRRRRREDPMMTGAALTSPSGSSVDFPARIAFETSPPTASRSASAFLRRAVVAMARAAVDREAAPTVSMSSDTGESSLAQSSRWSP